MNRQRFQGVLNVLSFNRHFYLFGIIALLVLAVSQSVFNWNQRLFSLILFVFSYGLIMPLLVSAYVYDFSGFYNFNWLENMKVEDKKGNLNLNINAGFDETSYIIKNVLPNSHLQVYDFYNAKQHTEAAIIRARKVSSVYPNTQKIDSNIIPEQDNSVNNVFLISALHEIRNQDEKIQFLKECRRVCKVDGQVIIVEHLRDFPNFLAFTIGFTHFFSKSTWVKALNEAGFTTIHERKFTPFMSIFKCR